jgi:hypothetical protein
MGLLETFSQSLDFAKEILGRRPERICRMPIINFSRTMKEKNLPLFLS